MSVFTKIFIVVNLGLTLVLTGVMGTLATQKASHYATYKTRHDEFVNHTRTMTQERDYHKSALTTLNSSIETQKKEANEAYSQFEKATQERSEKSGEYAQKEKQKNQLYTRIKTLQKSNNNLNEAVKVLVQQRSQAASTRDKAVSKMEKALNRLKERQDNIKSVKAGAQQIKEMHQGLLATKTEIEGLLKQAKNRGIPVVDIVERVKIDMSAFKISGRLKRVDPAVFLVFLDVGSDDKVKERMVFTVFRPGLGYICRVRVRKVEADHCSAIILQDTVFTGRSPKAGDSFANYLD